MFFLFFCCSLRERRSEVGRDFEEAALQAAEPQASFIHKKRVPFRVVPMRSDVRDIAKKGSYEEAPCKLLLVGSIVGLRDLAVLCVKRCTSRCL